MIDTLKINDFALAMLEAANLDDLLWVIAENVGRTLGFDDCVIYIREGETLVQMAAYGIKNPKDREVLERIEIKVGSGIVGAVAKTCQAEIISDTRLDVRYIGDQFSGLSELAVPVIYEGKAIAIIDTEASKVDSYSEEDKDFLQLIANIASPRIVSAQYNRRLKITQKRLERSNKELEQKILDLKQNQQSLIQSEKMASIGLLSAGFAHEINNPLAFSLSNLYSLSRYVEKIQLAHQQIIDNEEIPKCALEPIRNARYTHMMEDMIDLTNDTRDGLLSAKKIVSDLCGYIHRDRVRFTYVDINKEVNTALNILSNRIKNSCTLDVELNPLPQVHGCAGKINQVIINIVLNAIQANSDSSLIKIRTDVEENNIVIEISDNGPGIPEENINDIFTPFFTTKPVGVGTGLGLFVCYKIITEEHLGTMSVESTNQMTTFRITLPFRSGSSELIVNSLKAVK